MSDQTISKQENYLQSIILVIVWLLGNFWTWQWFVESLKDSSLFNLVTLGLVFIALSVQLSRNNFFQLESITPVLKLYPVLLIVMGEIGAILLKWFINIPQLTLLCFILGSYGLLGLFISSDRWNKGLTLATLTACVIPFSVAFNSGLGFPVRVITAHTVALVLSDFHLSAVSSHDIIIMENGIAQVDLPCSGMKSLWTGTVFLLGATWLERRQLRWRWLLVAIANLGFLIVANVVRVLILVLLIEVWQQRQIAEVLHLPLGVIGFILASVLTWLLLQRVPRTEFKRKPEREIGNRNFYQQQNNFNWLLAGIIILVIVGQLQPFKVNKLALNSINIPAEIITETLPLTTAEADFFNNPAHPFVQKIRFNNNNLSGSMLLVASDSWQAHHPPELCFLGNGLKVDKMDSQLIANSINARWLSLQTGELSATYWFQSQQQTTDDFISRIWENITHPHKTWVLVSVLFDKTETPNSKEVRDFTQTIYQIIARI
jgi:exosortase O